MRKFNLTAAAWLALGLAACADQPTLVTPGEAPVSSASQANEVIRDRYFVVFRDDVADAPGLARQLTEAHGGKMHHTLQHTMKGFIATLPPAAVEALRRNPRVDHVTPDMRVYPATTQISADWGIDRVDQRDRPLYGHYDYTRTGFGVTAYVIDSGIETLADFGGRASIVWDGVNDGVEDCSGHGTAVASALGSNTYGVAKAVRLAAVKAMSCTNASWGTVAAGIDWVAGNAVRPAVANISLGSGYHPDADRAVRGLVASGITVVVAAGNMGGNACDYTPSQITEAIVVGATNSSDVPWVDSNQGSCVDLFAPGEAVRTHVKGGGTSLLNGTSISAPYVAGAAALYLQGAPTATHTTVQSFLVNNATYNRLSNLKTGSPNALLYTQATVDSYKRIRNAWQTTKAINNETGTVAATTYQTSWHSAMWVVEPVPGTSYYYLRNRHTSQYLHAQYGSLQVTAAEPGWWTAMWILEPVNGYYRIKNRYTNGYLHVEYGNLQMGTIQSGWLSAQWSLDTV